MAGGRKQGRRSASARDVTRSTIVTGNQNIIGNDVFDTVEPTALHQLRPPVGDFVGREREIETLINTLRRESRAAITGISGMGGIGKTELALLVAERLQDDYPDAQFFINLQGTDAEPRSPQDVMAICLRAFLGPETKLPEDLEQLSHLYRSELNGRRALLLLDNAADSAQVRPLLPPAGCAVLVTSRQLIVLPGMTPLTLHPLNDEEAQQLLLEIAPRAEPAVTKICELCGYLPLALRAAGSLLAITFDLDPVEYATQLAGERQRLERIGTEGIEISVTASFNLSYERLTEETALVFRMLSVFPATFDGGAEEIVCDDAAHTHLSDLVRRSLVLWDEGTKRYRLHDLALLFADEKLTTEERDIGKKRFATYYGGQLAAANDLYLKGGESLLMGLALFDLEWGNIQAGHDWVTAQANTSDADVTRLALTYPEAGAYVLDLRQHSSEQIRWLEIALATARRLEQRRSEGNALGNLGIAYKNLGKTRRAIEFQEQALLIDREIGNRQGEGAALGNLGIGFKNLGETARAIEFFEQALVIAREIGDRRAEGATLGNLGLAYADLSETHRAIDFFEERLIIAREIGDRRGEGIVLGSLGTAYASLGDTRRAIQFYEQQLLIVHEIGDRRGEGTALGNLGIAFKNLGEPRRAIEFHEQALVIAREIGDRRGKANALGNLGTAYRALGEPRRAIEFYEQQLLIVREIGNRRGEGNALGNLGTAYAVLGETRRAVELYKQQLLIAREIGNRTGEGIALWNTSLALDQIGERSQAIQLAEQALVIYEQVEHPSAAKVRAQLAGWREFPDS